MVPCLGPSGPCMVSAPVVGVCMHPHKCAYSAHCVCCLRQVSCWRRARMTTRPRCGAWPATSRCRTSRCTARRSTPSSGLPQVLLVKAPARHAAAGTSAALHTAIECLQYHAHHRLPGCSVHPAHDHGNERGQHPVVCFAPQVRAQRTQISRRCS
jgi:hypothetical protein